MISVDRHPICTLLSLRQVPEVFGRVDIDRCARTDLRIDIGTMSDAIGGIGNKARNAQRCVRNQTSGRQRKKNTKVYRELHG